MWYSLNVACRADMALVLFISIILHLRRIIRRIANWHVKRKRIRLAVMLGICLNPLKPPVRVTCRLLG